jgi:cytidine deaminase
LLHDETNFGIETLAVPSEEMIALARKMIDRAYAPYSNFPVAAVLRGANGKLYAGCNVENASFPQGTCAEVAAIAVMVADGERRIVEAVVMGQGDTLIAPCGGCRQHLREFAGETVPIHLCDDGGVRRTVTMGELLPLAFGPDNLIPHHDDGG